MLFPNLFIVQFPPKIRRFPSFDTLPFIYPLDYLLFPNKHVQVEPRLKDRRSNGILKGPSPLNTVRNKESSKKSIYRSFRRTTWTTKNKRRSSFISYTGYLHRIKLVFGQDIRRREIDTKMWVHTTTPYKQPKKTPDSLLDKVHRGGRRSPNDR